MQRAMILIKYSIEMAELNQYLPLLTITLLECNTCHEYSHDVTDKLKTKMPEPAYKYSL